MSVQDLVQERENGGRQKDLWKRKIEAGACKWIGNYRKRKNAQAIKVEEQQDAGTGEDLPGGGGGGEHRKKKSHIEEGEGCIRVGGKKPGVGVRTGGCERSNWNVERFWGEAGCVRAMRKGTKWRLPGGRMGLGSTKFGRQGIRRTGAKMLQKEDGTQKLEKMDVGSGKNTTKETADKVRPGWLVTAIRNRDPRGGVCKEKNIMDLVTHGREKEKRKKRGSTGNGQRKLGGGPQEKKTGSAVKEAWGRKCSLKKDRDREKRTWGARWVPIRGGEALQRGKGPWQ